jgi:hypothetical protein
MNERHGLDDLPHLATLGELLTAAGDRLKARHLPAYPWAAGLAPVLRRAAELSESWGQRFDRHENGERPPAADRRPGPAPGRPATGSASPPVRRPSGPDDAPQPEPDRLAGPVGSADPVEPADVARPVEQILPVDVRARLQSVAGPGAAAMRVRVDPEADAAARGQRADAVTVGTEVRMRSGRYRPDTAEGFALLAHEASHVTALLGRGPTGPRSAPGGPAAEEHQARQVERTARQSYGPGPRPPGSALTRSAAARTPSPGPPAAAPPNGSAPLPAPAGAAAPMRADTDRTEAATPPAFDMEALRRDLIDELMRRVRTDFERGG